jgi:hypothetical protein
VPGRHVGADARFLQLVKQSDTRREHGELIRHLTARRIKVDRLLYTARDLTALDPLSRKYHR